MQCNADRKSHKMKFLHKDATRCNHWKKGQDLKRNWFSVQQKVHQPETYRGCTPGDLLSFLEHNEHIYHSMHEYKVHFS